MNLYSKTRHTGRAGVTCQVLRNAYCTLISNFAIYIRRPHLYQTITISWSAGWKMKLAYLQKPGQTFFTTPTHRQHDWFGCGHSDLSLETSNWVIRLSTLPSNIYMLNLARGFYAEIPCWLFRLPLPIDFFLSIHSLKRKKLCTNAGVYQASSAICLLIKTIAWSDEFCDKIFIWETWTMNWHCEIPCWDSLLVHSKSLSNR